MKNRSQAASKAWETMKNKSIGRKANYTKRRKAGAKKAVIKVKNKQWNSEKVKYLKELKKDAISNTCVVCNDGTSFVLQCHHADPDKKIIVKLCANCHDTVRRGTLDDLKKAYKRNKV